MIECMVHDPGPNWVVVDVSNKDSSIPIVPDGLREEAPPDQRTVSPPPSVESTGVCVLSATKGLAHLSDGTLDEKVEVRRQDAIGVHQNPPRANLVCDSGKEVPNIVRGLE